MEFLSYWVGKSSYGIDDWKVDGSRGFQSRKHVLEAHPGGNNDYGKATSET
jgi:hypothetical protein